MGDSDTKELGSSRNHRRSSWTSGGSRESCRLPAPAMEGLEEEPADTPVPRREQKSTPCREEDTKTAPKGTGGNPEQERGQSGHQSWGRVGEKPTQEHRGTEEGSQCSQGVNQNHPLPYHHTDHHRIKGEPAKRAAGTRLSRGPHRGNPKARRERTTCSPSSDEIDPSPTLNSQQKERQILPQA